MRPFATTWTSFVLAAGLAVAQNSFTCPAMDRYLVTDANGVSYVIGCSSDSTNGNFAQSSVSGSFNDCFSICDSTSGCTCFTYGGGYNGVGSGFCYLKNSNNYGSEAFVAENNNDYVAAIQTQYYTGTINVTRTTTAPGHRDQDRHLHATSIHGHGHIHLSHDLIFYLHNFLPDYLYNYPVCEYNHNRFVLDSDSH
ncbi:hypothetical protein EJ03DRAFT_369727 [Teratosphaeria nubilosa]|uniref:Apple domain-containing protein n=1 Tax=Teratosphaeria nubilosa TaxID=161662 RepID=A0A6G1KX80_9PEZI|nr:hypothetical protein EJ03DRAFT_369727 [Teratosphaeria nubilosa]